ncbi:MAG: hypothetical protein JWQ89_502 [Devosia sp.]|uniref:hypothetical protein n=1 Tax=Devosia sp. TaxID=1871048 RepID=UPI00261E4768|nr:hypothetical protein [Devosia sp.]MDB5538775.1 hypothetical protein [Devosia sp.]
MAVIPVTAREFQLAGKFVIQDCPECLTRTKIEPSVITLTFGDDFDMFMGLREIRYRFDCPICGARRPDVYFGTPEQPLTQLEGRSKRA